MGVREREIERKEGARKREQVDERGKKERGSEEERERNKLGILLRRVARESPYHTSTSNRWRRPGPKL